MANGSNGGDNVYSRRSRCHQAIQSVAGWQAKPDCEIHILDNGAEAQAGERGEIVIAGPNVSAGYIHRPDLTERAFYRINTCAPIAPAIWAIIRMDICFLMDD